MGRKLALLLILALAGCGGLPGHEVTTQAPAGTAASPPPSELPLPAMSSDQARVERVLGMEGNRLWLSLSARPAGIDPQVLLTPRGMRLPSVTGTCPLERNLARALVVFVNERLAGQVMTLEGMALTEQGMVADAFLDGQPLLQRLQAEGLARPTDSPGWCP
ncbi:hypothetical protein [Ferrimonas sp. YFM]|uniref:hypothetical protein n=1 Tax=Ferrimonas sp. YFM TaxID=3028878 RepID=UPI0025733616|nr:hypothetical protein [Ferrimonas sp. YFM]BDY03385.1 hypothetical protein F0521_04260 [Ferrimonas sp. YFM]